MLYKRIKSQIRFWIPVLLITESSIFFLFFMEWLFHVTKPSLFSFMTAGERITALLGSPAIPSFVLFGLLCLLMIFGSLNQKCRSVARLLLVLVATIILSVSALLLIDNFTLTFFHFGLRNTAGLWVLIYDFVFVSLIAGLFLYLRGLEKGLLKRASFHAQSIVVLVLLFSQAAGMTIGHAMNLHVPLPAKAARSGGLPNIILIGSDGLSADRMSVYGYSRNTTPFIRRNQKSALIAQNAFSNASDTLGSLISILTGKLPTETGVFYSPDILRGKNAYENLPRILRSYGYRTAQFSMKIYADAYDANMREGFDFVNMRGLQGQKTSEWLSKIIGQNSDLFLRQTWGRVLERLRHCLGISKMEDPFAEVTDKWKGTLAADSQRYALLFQFIKSSRTTPFFAHIHSMPTHGRFFDPKVQIFSKGQDQTKPWMMDFYDDGVLEFDRNIQKLFAFLHRMRIFKNTMIIVYSDHAIDHTIERRVPLIIWFPNGKHSGVVGGNVQNIDIAPTILNYLKISKPEWMTGISLLAHTDRRCRWMIGVKTANIMIPTKQGMILGYRNAPYYCTGILELFIGNKLYGLDPDTKKFFPTPIQGYIGDASGCVDPGPAAVVKYLSKHLLEAGYKTTSIDGMF